MNIIKRYKKEALLGFVAGILNGLFGSGAGVVVVFAMEKFLKKDAKEAHASSVLIVLMMSVVSSFLYVIKGYFDLRIWAYVSIGGILGGFLGAKWLKKIPKKWLKLIFGAVILWASFKIIF